MRKTTVLWLLIWSQRLVDGFCVYGLTSTRSLFPQFRPSSVWQQRSTKKMSFGDNDDMSAADGEYSQSSIERRQKFHHLTVCMVPPETSMYTWEQLTRCRTELRDAGLYRWPPHANLLYPFLDIRLQPHQQQQQVDNNFGDNQQGLRGKSDGFQTNGLRNDHEDLRFENDGNATRDFIDSNEASQNWIDPSILARLVDACRLCDPFDIQLSRFGTFGNKKRGVLWLYPDSYRINDSENETEVEPLIHLQSLLVQSFPSCNDQSSKNESGCFHPHMTVSHFVDLDAAVEAQRRVEARWPNNVSFRIEYIYLLQREGDSGQFLRVADIPLGGSNAIIVYERPIPFRAMPRLEEDWVREERMKLKQRRRRRSRKGSDNQRGRDNPDRIPDTLEVIETKRAARKLKRDGMVSCSDRDMPSQPNSSP